MLQSQIQSSSQPQFQPQIRHPRELELSLHTIQLRVQVERLEFARRDAAARRDRTEVESIDKQIVQASREWAESVAADHEERFRQWA
jgi:hypothetical protein